MKMKTNNRQSAPLIGLAPLAGFTESAFRRLCRELGADFTWTELISADFLVNRGLNGPLCYVSAAERPLRFQLHGSREKTLVQAARLVLEEIRPEGLDLNAGCPARKIVKAGAGAALLATPKKLARLARTLAELAHAYGVDFSVKFRLGFAQDELERLTEALLGAGVDLLVLHPRTAKEGFRGQARWERIRDLVRMVGDEARVFGSGDVKSLADVKAFFACTGAHGVLIGRAALSRPWIFKECKTREERELSLAQRVALLKRLERYLLSYRSPKDCLRVLKTFAPKFFKGISGRRKFTPALLKAPDLATFWEILEALAGDGRLEK